MRSSDPHAHHAGPAPSPAPGAAAQPPGPSAHQQPVVGAALERFYPARFLDRAQDGHR